jgi:hypothetical protein
MSSPFSGYLIASPPPSTHTGFCLQPRATCADAITTAPPPSEIMQHSSMCSGSAITREPTTSSTVISPVPLNCRSVIACTACGLRVPWRRVATLMAARCSAVVPYWYAWRCATSA